MGQAQSGVGVISPLAVDTRHIVRAILQMIAATAVFAGMNALAKLLGSNLPPPEVAFARLAVNMLMLLPWMVMHRISFLGTRRRALATRSLAGTAALTLNFSAAVALPLADFGALMRSGVFFTVGLSALLLREHVSARRWLLVCGGFLGVILLLQPTGGGALTGGLQALGAAFFGSISAISIRELRDSEHACTIIFQFCAYGMIILLLFFGWQFEWPKGSAWWLLIACGLLGSIGQVLVTDAFQRAPASIIAPYSFSEVLFVTLIGITCFGEVLGLRTIIGALIIIVVGVLLGHGTMREAKGARHVVST